MRGSCSKPRLGAEGVEGAWDIIPLLLRKLEYHFLSIVTIQSFMNNICVMSHKLVNKILNMFITCAWLMITNRILIIITIIRSSLESLNFDLEYLVKVILRYVYIYYILR